MGFSVTHLIIFGVIVLVLFGAGKIPTVMGDVAKGIKSFKKGLKDDDEPASPPPAAQPMRTIDAEQPRPVMPTRQDEPVQR